MNGPYAENSPEGHPPLQPIFRGLGYFFVVLLGGSLGVLTGLSLHANEEDWECGFNRSMGSVHDASLFGLLGVVTGAVLFRTWIWPPRQYDEEG